MLYVDVRDERELVNKVHSNYGTPLRVIDCTMPRTTYQTASPNMGTAHVRLRDGSEARVTMRNGYVTKVHV